MVTKRTTKKGATKAAPNKQRITFLSAREKLAAVSGGIVDDRIPVDVVLMRLRNEPGVAFDAEPILKSIASSAGRCRGFNGKPAPRLEPAEVVAQAVATIALIDELGVRLSSTHPEIDCWASDMMWRARGETLVEVSERIEPDLMRLRAAFDHARETIAAYPAKTGPKRSPWMTARAAVASTLRDKSTPRMAEKAARALSEDLMKLCGLDSPRKGR